MLANLILLYGGIVQYVENFFGNVKDVRKNTYYEIDTTISDPHTRYALKEEITFCLQQMSQHPQVPPLPSQKRHVNISTFENDEFKYTHGNISGQCTHLYGNCFCIPLDYICFMNK